MRIPVTIHSRFSRQSRLAISFCIAITTLTGCTTNNAVFVTKTSFSVLDVDAAPAGISVAHDRVEGYFGPRFDDGTVYPVTGYFAGRNGLLDREVQQVFAGGEAATVVLGEAPGTTSTASCGDDRNLPPLLFATGTTIGIKLGFAENTLVPTSFVFGYRRKEAATVPVSKSCQPSVIASLGSSARQGSDAANPALNAGISQYFATGKAAIALAKDPTIRKAFVKEAQKALTHVDEFNTREAAHNALALDIIVCAGKLSDSDFDSVITNAAELGLLPDSGDAARIRAGSNPKDRFALYQGALRLRNGDEDPRTAALTVHKDRVCNLAKTA